MLIKNINPKQLCIIKMSLFIWSLYWNINFLHRYTMNYNGVNAN